MSKTTIAGTQSTMCYNCGTTQGSHCDKSPSGNTGILHTLASLNKSVKNPVRYLYFTGMFNYFFFWLFYQDGLLRVLLDGGPSRIFLVGDAKLLEEDLEVLKVPAFCLFEYRKWWLTLVLKSLSCQIVGKQLLTLLTWGQPLTTIRGPGPTESTCFLRFSLQGLVLGFAS